MVGGSAGGGGGGGDGIIQMYYKRSGTPCDRAQSTADLLVQVIEARNLGQVPVPLIQGFLSPSSSGLPNWRPSFYVVQGGTNPGTLKKVGQLPPKTKVNTHL